MTAKLWTGEAFAAALGADVVGALPDVIRGISIDSRTVGKGEAFFAIAGERFDGHAFVAAALERGAALAVVSRAKLGELGDAAPLLVVEDALEGLNAAARAARARSTASIVAVTGSVGKTSTKEALRLVLGKEGPTHAAEASFNNHWGVPLTLARLPESARFGVFEIGMNHAGEITPLTRLVRPHVAVITTVEPVHIEHFPSEEAIADAKAEIFLGLERSGTAVLNRDNRHFDRLARAAVDAGVAVASFGEHPQSDARLLKVALHPQCSCVRASVLGTEVTYKIGAPGRHLVQNSLAVLLAARLAGADFAVAALALADFKPAKGRGQRHVLATPSGIAVLLDESYNANPASMRAALALLGQSDLGPKGRRIAVLGDMLELGEQGPSYHAGLAEAVAAADVDLLFTAGPLMRNLHNAVPAKKRGGWAQSSSALESEILTAVRGGDVVMIKGSHGSRMEPIVAALTERFAAADAGETSEPDRC